MSRLFSRYAFTSPSSRRAWIEIIYEQAELNTRPVALLAEGVDRNTVSLVNLLP